MLDFTQIEAGRWLASGGVIAGYAALCWRQYRRAQPALAYAGDASGAGTFCVVYASQTGQAEALARQAVQALSATGLSAQLFRIDEDWQSAALGARCTLFVASTYGEGSAPDHALHFAQQRMTESAALRGMRYGLLALGDRNYPAFCAFGRRLDAWLRDCGAQAEFPGIEADRLDNESLATWQQRLQALGANPVAAVAERYEDWQFVERRCLNEGSPGSPIYLVSLQAGHNSHPRWQAGDLVDIQVPDGDGRSRAYSIANLPGQGRIELIVRRYIRDDGSVGMASGWLTERAQVGDGLALKIRSNPAFHLQHDPARPLILIGTGAGIAGLRGHLQAKAEVIAQNGGMAPARSAWLFFGERSGRHDYLCKLEIEAMKQARVLTRADMTFSRDDPVAPYVQHSLQARAAEVIEWIEHGADILICGNAKKMAVSVDKTLRRILGADTVDRLLEAGRIQREVF